MPLSRPWASIVLASLIATVLGLAAPGAQASLPEGGGKIPPSPLRITADSQQYPETGYCARTGIGLNPPWAGAFPFWHVQCQDIYDGGIDPHRNLVLGNTLFNGRTYRIRVFDLGTRRLKSSINVSAAGWSALGLHVGTDGRYYLLLGRDNLNDSDTYTTLAVRAYTPSLQLVGTAKVPGDFAGLGVGAPASARADMTLKNGILLVHMSRMLYSGGSFRHEANLSFAVDTATMQLFKGEELNNASYTSHSFAQHVEAVGDDAVLVDHGDGYPRAVKLSVIPDFFDRTATDSPTRTYNLLRIQPQNATGENYTGTTVNDLAAGSSRVLTVGASLPHGRAVRGITGVKRLHAPNVYVASTNVATGATTWRWLTNFDPRSRTAVVGEPRIVKISANRFAMLYHVETGHNPRNPAYNGRLTFVYLLLDQYGKTLARKTWAGYWFMPETRLFSARNRIWWQAGYLRRAGDRLRTQEHLFGLNVTNPRQPSWVR